MQIHRLITINPQKRESKTQTDKCRIDSQCTDRHPVLFPNRKVHGTKDTKRKGLFRGSYTAFRLHPVHCIHSQHLPKSQLTFPEFHQIIPYTMYTTWCWLLTMPKTYIHLISSIIHSECRG